jgi:hypothetical protein
MMTIQKHYDGMVKADFIPSTNPALPSVRALWTGQPMSQFGTTRQPSLARRQPQLPGWLKVARSGSQAD